MTTRAAKRAQVREAEEQQEALQQAGTRPRRVGPGPLRIAAFVAVTVLILGAGGYLASSVFLGQRDNATTAGAIPMRISMAGFDPAVLHAKPGQTLTIDWWNTDGAMHLEGGVHTLVSDALNVRLELPAESRKTITLTAPTTPGTYDFWCDSCCGGKDSSDMHGKLEVQA